jgi:hypothetical protein
MDGTLGLFRRNSGCSVDQKTLGILFRTISWKRKMFGILNSGTKIEANPRNSVPNYSAEEKNAWKKTLGVPFRTITRKRKMFHGTKIEANSWNSVPKHLTTFKVQTNKKSLSLLSSSTKKQKNGQTISACIESTYLLL